MLMGNRPLQAACLDPVLAHQVGRGERIVAMTMIG